MGRIAARHAVEARGEAGVRHERRFLSPCVAAARSTIDDRVMPHATRKRPQTSLRSLRNENARALAMLKNKHVEVPQRKHDNLPV